MNGDTSIIFAIKVGNEDGTIREVGSLKLTLKDGIGQEEVEAAMVANYAMVKTLGDKWGAFEP